MRREGCKYQPKLKRKPGGRERSRGETEAPSQDGSTTSPFNYLYISTCSKFLPTLPPPNRRNPSPPAASAPQR